MNAARTTTLSLGFSLALCLAAQAQTTAPDGGLKANGASNSSSGSDPIARMGRMGSSPSDYMRAGEATTFINGQPNVNPDIPAWTARPAPVNTQTMGGSAAMGYDARTGSSNTQHPLWGTPD